MTWNEADHPRAPKGVTEGGQFIPKDSVGKFTGKDAVRAVIAARKAAQLPRGMTEAERFKKTREFKEWVTTRHVMNNGNEVEYGWIITPEGEIVDDWIGGESEYSIILSEKQKEQQEGNYFIHNHPNDSIFSGNDLYSGIKLGSRGMIATNDTGFWVVDFIKEGIEFDNDPDLAQFNRDYIAGIAMELHKDFSFQNDQRVRSVFGSTFTEADDAMRSYSEGVARDLNENRHTSQFLKVRWIPWEMKYDVE